MTNKATNTKDSITFSKSGKKDKKCKAVFKDGTIVHFGPSSCEHFKDTTGVGAWSHKDHGDAKRRGNYHKRHGRDKETNKTSAIF